MNHSFKSLKFTALTSTSTSSLLTSKRAMNDADYGVKPRLPISFSDDKHPAFRTLPPELFGRLLCAYRNGSKEALQRLMIANQGLINYHIAKAYGYLTPEQKDDLYQEANLGLYRALQIFDPAKASFSNYATRWIRAFCLDFISKNANVVTISQSQRKQRDKVRRSFYRLAEAGLEDISERVAADTGLSAAKVDAIMALNTSSLDAPSSSAQVDEGGPLLDTLEGSSDVLGDAETASMKRVINSCLAELPAKQALVVRLYYGITDHGAEGSFSEVGKRMGFTREYARILYNKAISALKPLLAEALGHCD